MIVRDSRPGDHAAIRRVLIAAFAGADEADLVEQLRSGGFAEIELVAEDEGEVIGHILFSRMETPFPALGLAPVSVLPPRQRQGVGGLLIGRGHEIASAGAWEAIYVLGDPEYYQRFGYSVEEAQPFRSVYSGRHFMMKALKRPLSVTAGEVAYPPPFAEL